MLRGIFGETFPWGTLAVNVVGSLIIGFFATLTDTDGRWLVAPSAREFVMIGCAAATSTFSSLSLQTLNLAREWFRAGANATLSFVLAWRPSGLAMCWRPASIHPKATDMQG